MSLFASMDNIGRPIAYYPQLAKFFGSVNAAIFFAQLFYWQQRADSDLGVYKSSEEWQEETGLSYREQATARKILVERGMLVETHKRLEHRIYFMLDREVVDKAYALWNEAQLANADKAFPERRKRISGNAENAIGGEREAQFDHKTENTAETTAEETPPAEAEEVQSDAAVIDEVFEFWKTAMSHPRAKVDDKRKKLIRKALKLYELSDLKDAIIGCTLSPYHMGHNDVKTRYDSLELILRDASHIDRFISYKLNPPKWPNDLFKAKFGREADNASMHESARRRGIDLNNLDPDANLDF